MPNVRTETGINNHSLVSVFAQQLGSFVDEELVHHAGSSRFHKSKSKVTSISGVVRIAAATKVHGTHSLDDGKRIEDGRHGSEILVEANRQVRPTLIGGHQGVTTASAFGAYKRFC
jgi:hypothetical protein